MRCLGIGSNIRSTIPLKKSPSLAKAPTTPSTTFSHFCMLLAAGDTIVLCVASTSLISHDCLTSFFPHIFRSYIPWRASKRWKLRLEELLKGFDDVAAQLTARPHLSPNDSWPLAVQLFGTKSLDSIVAYFAGFAAKTERSNIKGQREDVAGNPLLQATSDHIPIRDPIDVSIPPAPSNASSDETKPKIAPQSPPSMPQALKQCSSYKARHRVTKCTSKQPKITASKPKSQITNSPRYHLHPRIVRQSVIPKRQYDKRR